MSTSGPAEWQAAGLYDPTAPDADDQVELLEYLTVHGATVDDMVAAKANRSLNAAASDRVLKPERTVTRADAATGARR